MKYNPEEIEILKELDEKGNTAIREKAILRTYQRGEIIIWEQEACEFVYFILEGEVEIFRLSSNGREQIFERLRAGECFNLAAACLDDALNAANARALTLSRLLALRREEFTTLLKTDARLSLVVARYFAGRLQKMAHLVESLSLLSVRQRLARFLIEQADSVGTEKGQRWTQTDMARRLGTVRDVLGRALRRLADEGAVRFERDRIVLQNRDKLERAASGED